MLREKIRATSALNAQDCGRNEGESHPGSGVEHSGPLRIDPSEDIQISVMLNKATRIGAHRAELGLKPGTHVGRDLVQCGNDLAQNWGSGYRSKRLHDTHAACYQATNVLGS